MSTNSVLIGVSIDYHVRMERGNLAGAHLFDLARAAHPGPAAAPKTTGVTDGVQQVLDAVTEAPAWVRNARHDMLAASRMARALASVGLHGGHCWARVIRG